MSHILYSRRRWIQSVGLGLSAPLFSPLLRSTFAQGAGVIPRRFVIVLAGNGIESANLLSPATQAVIESQGTGSLDGQRYNFHTRYGHSNPIVNRVADLHLAPALSALNGGADLMDLREKAAVLYGLSNKVAGGGHSAGYGALSASAGRGSSPTSMTIEAWLARSLSGRSAYPFDAVRLGVVQSPTQRLQYGLCGRESGKAAPIIVDPHVAYSSLFGSVASADGRRAFDDRSDLLSFARSDVRRVLAAFSGSSRERQKLEVYLESLETLQRRQTRLQDAEGTLEQVRPADPNEDARFASPHPLERLAVQFD